MARTVGVKEAHQKLTRLIRAAEEGDQVVITREGTPVAILLGADQFNSMIATLEEMADPGGAESLKRSAGRRKDRPGVRVRGGIWSPSPAGSAQEASMTELRFTRRAVRDIRKMTPESCRRLEIALD